MLPFRLFTRRKIGLGMSCRCYDPDVSLDDRRPSNVQYEDIRSGDGGLVVLCGFDRAWKTRVPQRARRHMAVASHPGRDCGVRRMFEN